MDHTAPHKLTIGVLDSGFGGLTVLAELLQVLPEACYIYFGDNARAPYGDRSVPDLQKIAEEDVRLLQQYHIDILVVACNTLSACCLDQLGACFRGPVVGTILPAVRRAARENAASIGIIGTTATVRSNLYPEALLRLQPGADIRSLACPTLAPMVEAGDFEGPHTEQLVREALQPWRVRAPELVILGCTHYPILQNAIQTALPDSRLLDPARAVAEETAVHAAVLLTPDSRGSVQLLTSADSTAFRTIAARILGVPESALSVQHVQTKEPPRT